MLTLFILLLIAAYVGIFVGTLSKFKEYNIPKEKSASALFVPMWHFIEFPISVILLNDNLNGFRKVYGLIVMAVAFPDILKDFIVTLSISDGVSQKDHELYEFEYRRVFRKNVMAS